MLKLHARRSNYTAKLWRQADQKIMFYGSPQQHVRNEDYSLEWVNEIFPIYIANHLEKRHVEYDCDTNSHDEDGLKYDKDDFD